MLAWNFPVLNEESTLTQTNDYVHNRKMTQIALFTKQSELILKMNDKNSSNIDPAKSSTEHASIFMYINSASNIQMQVECTRIP